MHTILFNLLPIHREPFDNSDDVKNRRQQARALARSMRRGRFIYMLVIALLLLAVVTVGGTQPSAWLFVVTIALFVQDHMPFLLWQPIAGWLPLLVFVGCVLFGVVFLVFSLPLAWYLHVLLPRRYGLQKDKTLSWLRDVRKQLFIVAIPLWFFAELLTLLLVVQPQTWWAWIALVQFLYTLFVARFGTHWLLPWLHKITPLHEGELVERLHKLLGRLRLPACSLYQVSVSHRTNAANAYFTGWGGGRRILLTDTMIQHFTIDEMEVILAHELAHLMHHDIWKRIIMRSLIFLSVIYVFYLDVTDGSWLNTLFASLSMLQILDPLIALLLVFLLISMTMRYHRYQEKQADEFALHVTGNVQAFRMAMTRLAQMNMMIDTPSRYARLFMSHPTLQQRLQHANEFVRRRDAALAHVS